MWVGRDKLDKLPKSIPLGIVLCASSLPFALFAANPSVLVAAALTFDSSYYHPCNPCYVSSVSCPLLLHPDNSSGITLHFLSLSHTIRVLLFVQSPPFLSDSSSLSLFHCWRTVGALLLK